MLHRRDRAEAGTAKVSLAFALMRLIYLSVESPESMPPWIYEYSRRTPQERMHNRFPIPHLRHVKVKCLMMAPPAVLCLSGCSPFTGALTPASGIAPIYILRRLRMTRLRSVQSQCCALRSCNIAAALTARRRVFRLVVLETSAELFLFSSDVTIEYLQHSFCSTYSLENVTSGNSWMLPFLGCYLSKQPLTLLSSPRLFSFQYSNVTRLSRSCPAGPQHDQPRRR